MGLYSTNFRVIPEETACSKGQGLDYHMEKYIQQTMRKLKNSSATSLQEAALSLNSKNPLDVKKRFWMNRKLRRRRRRNIDRQADGDDSR